MKRDSPVGITTTLNNLSEEEIEKIFQLMKDGQRKELDKHPLVLSVG